ncbi:TonB-dependent receptor [Mucilaginibacter xinganensis]|uniref:TonB-dependent receptor n=1 Tax=Mucilaginibacter xinganensis TaxID=1234841 RepID=A0A223NWG9_9SPHI|nr:TonB-dependent receptor [Mucilaginibacter xinganensis]ASU34166.1 TonB-dependent receptor [Mucilaginibacter xinganensis]
MKSKLRSIKISFLLTALFVLCNAVSFAQTIKGSVTSAKNGETLIGATVHIQKGDFNLNTTVRLDGTYVFKNVPAGIYTLQVKFVGYKTTNDYSVEVTGTETAVLNVAMADNSTSLNEVTITEHASKESDKSARSDERNANNTMNAVSAHSIAISPDVLVSNVLSRVSGISVDRGNTGDAQHAIIRGMDKQYNTTLINGVKIPSPDNKNRYVPLDIFPAELVEKIEISKSLTPEMEGDASGGVINLVMKTAPDKLRIDGYLGTGYSQLFINRGFKTFNSGQVRSKAPGETLPPLGLASINDFPYQNLVTRSKNAPPNADFSLTIGDRFLDKKLGVIFSGSYRNDYAGNNSFEMVQTHTVGPAPDVNSVNTETNFQSSYNRKYSSQISRLGTIASVDYKFDANNSINLFGSYLQLNEHRVRETENFVYGGYSYQGYHYTNGIDNLTETRTDLQSIYNVTLKGNHKINNAFAFDWTVANSEAQHKQPDIAEFKTAYNTSPGPNGTNEPTPGNPGSSTYVASTIINGPRYVQDESRVWTHNTDKDISAYLNLHYDTRIFGRKALFAAGGMFRHKTRDNFVDRYTLNHGSDPGSPTSDELYVSVPDSKFQFNSPEYARGSSYSDPGVYTFTENIQGVYADLKYILSDRLNILFGLRGEKTYQHYDSSLPVTFPGKTATINYTDYLPSINAKYSLTENQAIRASYFQSVLRPAYADLIPYPDATGETYVTQGNPYLQHTTINNFDLRYEAFPGAFDELLFGAFYKYLINPIEQQFIHGTGESLVLQPVNLGNAHNYGLEFSAKKYFGNIGFGANYTYTHSVITSVKRIDVVNQSEPTYRDQTRPLQGQATHIGNFSLLYKDTRNGLDAQLAVAYTGERIRAVSEYYGLDTWEKASVNLDFSAQKSFSKHWVIFVKVNNILNTPYQLFIKQNNINNYTGILKYPHQESPNYTTIQYDQYYARYNLGARFNF